MPDDARDFLRGRITEYGRDPGNQRRPDVERFEAVETVRAVQINSLFTGDIDLSATDTISGWQTIVPSLSPSTDSRVSASGVGGAPSATAS